MSGRMYDTLVEPEMNVFATFRTNTRRASELRAPHQKRRGTRAHLEHAVL